MDSWLRFDNEWCVFGYVFIYIDHKTPESTTTTVFEVFPLLLPTASRSLRRPSPSTGLPKTTCFPSSHGQSTKVRKNCDPLVFGPALAIESTGPLCLKGKPSSYDIFKDLNIPWTWIRRLIFLRFRFERWSHLLEPWSWGWFCGRVIPCSRIPFLLKFQI